MGIIITDGRAFLQFNGSFSKFEKAIVALSKFEKTVDGLSISSVPLPEKGAICVELQFSGPITEFEKVIFGLEELMASVAIDTVPLPESLAIGSWPTPERPSKGQSWIISACSEVESK